MNSSTSENFRRILGRVTQQDFVGRAGELDRIMAHAEPANAGRGLLLLMEPSAGVSDLQPALGSHSHLLRNYTK